MKSKLATIIKEMTKIVGKSRQHEKMMKEMK